MKKRNKKQKNGDKCKSFENERNKDFKHRMSKSSVIMKEESINVPILEKYLWQELSLHDT